MSMMSDTASILKCVCKYLRSDKAGPSNGMCSNLHSFLCVTPKLKQVNMCSCNPHSSRPVSICHVVRPSLVAPQRLPGPHA